MLGIDSNIEDYLLQFLEQSKTGIIVSDPNQEGNPVVFVNNTTCNTFEYERSDFIGRNCNFLQADDKDQPELSQIREAISKRVAVTSTLRNYTKSGKLVYNQFTISPIFDNDKNLKYFLGVQRDVTNEVLLKQENDSLQDEKIDNAQFNAIGKLSAGISHEINTPLTIIKGNMELLKASVESLENPDKEYMLEDIALIEENLNRIKNITESIREVADTEEFEMREMNLYRALIISLRLTYNKSKNITKIKLLDEFFTLDIDREKRKFLINAAHRKMEQVFIAIIENAIDQFNIYGDYDINLLSIDIKENKNSYEVIFQDNGGGIDPKILPNIFKPFNSSKNHKGLGIGLSVVKKIIDEHGFKIKISNNNKGALVKIIIEK